MPRGVKALTVPAYSWECPGCHEWNLDSGTELEEIHSEYNMDYLCVKCSSCNGSYVLEHSLGWLTKFRTLHGGRLDNLRKVTLT